MPPEKSIPLEVPVPGKSESFTDKIRRATDWIFGREKKEIQNAGAEERAKLQESLKKEKLPQIVTEVQRARKEIMKSTLKEGVESVLGTLEDPRGQKYPFTFPRSINNSNTLTIPYIGGYRVTLLPIPKTNGYNSEFRIQAQKIGTNEPQEEWRKLAVRYTTSTPDYRILTQEIKKSEKKEETLDEQRQALIGEISLIEKKLIQKKPVLSKQSKAKLIARKRDINSSLPRIEAHLRIAKNEAQKVQWALDQFPKEKRYEDFAFTPYAQVFDTPEVRKSGFQYLNTAVDTAWNAPQVGNFMTPFENNQTKLVAKEAFPREIGITLAIVERMDFVKYLKAWDPKTKIWTLRDSETVEKLMTEQIQKALTTVALNRETTFNYQRSDAGAKGIAQIMPASHRLMRNEYPEALSSVVGNPNFYHSEFEHAAGNEQQSLRFMMMHLVDQGKQLQWNKGFQENWGKIISDPKARLGMYGLLAAGYNGSMRRVREEAFGGTKTSHTTYTDIQKLLEQSSLLENVSDNKETYTYVMKFAFVWNYLKENYPDQFDVPPKPPVQNKVLKK